MRFGEIRKPLLIFCLSASIALHIGAVWFLYNHPLSFFKSESIALMKPAPSPKIIPKDDEELLVEKIEKALEESLNEVVALNSKSQANQDIAKVEEKEEEKVEEKKYAIGKKISSSASKIQEEPLQMDLPKEEYTSTMPPPFDPELEASLAEFAFEEDGEDEMFSYESEKYASVDFSDHRLYEESLQITPSEEEDYRMTEDQFSPSALPMENSESLAPHFVASLKRLKTQTGEMSEEMNEEKMFKQLPESTSPKLVLPNSVDYLRNQWIKRSLAERKLPELEDYGLEEIASSLEWEEDIEVDVALLPDSENNRYIFSLTIHPEFETDCQSMRQNFYFLIDNSGAVEKNKFSRYKRAVQRSLAALCDGDTFNIFLFDKKSAKLSDRNFPVSPKTLQMAEDFLERQSSKSHYTGEDIYSSLEKILPNHLNPDEMHSVILISDGNSLASANKQKKAIESWTKKFENNVNFYTAAAGKGNNLVSLDLLSYTTSGKLLYSDTNAAFPRKLVRLVKDLHHPIVKNVTIDISPEDPNTKVFLFPQSPLLPPMFLNQPYVVVGTVDECSDFTLFIQGKNQDRFLNIRKKISLKDATRGGRTLEKLWAHSQSKLCYDRFLKNGKVTHLKEAKQIVAPYRGAISMD